MSDGVEEGGLTLAAATLGDDLAICAEPRVVALMVRAAALAVDRIPMTDDERERTIVAAVMMASGNSADPTKVVLEIRNGSWLGRKMGGT